MAAWADRLIRSTESIVLAEGAGHYSPGSKIYHWWFVTEVCWHSSAVTSRMVALRLLEIALLFLRRPALPCGRPGAHDARHTSVTSH
jgi:hypothetical protein